MWKGREENGTGVARYCKRNAGRHEKRDTLDNIKGNERGRGEKDAPGN